MSIQENNRLLYYSSGDGKKRAGKKFYYGLHHKIKTFHTENLKQLASQGVQISTATMSAYSSPSYVIF